VSQPVLTFAQYVAHDVLTVVDDCNVQGSLPLIVLLLEVQFFAPHKQFDHGKTIQKYWWLGVEKEYSPAFEDGKMENVGPIVINRKVQILLHASKVHEECQVLLVYRLEELILPQIHR